MQFVIKSTANITRRNSYIEIFLLCSLVMNCCFARGPHHPSNSPVNKERIKEQKHINEHLAFETEHIKEDLEAHQLPTDKNVDELTEEEKNYLYFKVHDLDGNDKLDGLEIYYSATHHSVSQSPPERQESQESINHDNNEAHQVSQLNESESQHSSHLEILERDENGQLVDTNFNHIIDVLDNFLNLADLNNDGYLNYAEYAAAVKLGNAIVENERNQEL